MPKKLYRSRTNRKIWGVCGGLANHHAHDGGRARDPDGGLKRGYGRTSDEHEHERRNRDRLSFPRPGARVRARPSSGRGTR